MNQPRLVNTAQTAHVHMAAMSRSVARATIALAWAVMCSLSTARAQGQSAHCAMYSPVQGSSPAGVSAYDLHEVRRLPVVSSAVRHAAHTETITARPIQYPQATVGGTPVAHAPLPDDTLFSDPSAISREADEAAGEQISRLDGDFEDETSDRDVGVDFYSSGDFQNAISIPGTKAAIKIGGYVKVDLIFDFDPIDSTDLFDTTTIPTHAAPRTNTRFHARQSRLNFDVRWPTELGTARAFCEADFFSTGDHWRLRHAYGALGGLTIGQTWTTFTDMASLPTTLDFEGAVSSIGRRQAQVRWTQQTLVEGLTASIALEDPRATIDVAGVVSGDPRTPTPDLIGRARLTRDWGQLQVAGVWRQLGFQPIGHTVITEDAWGFNFTGALEPTDHDKAYFQILFGDGIGSYKGLTDAAVGPLFQSDVLPVFAWMIGWTHEWNDRWSSNFTYSENRIDNADFQPGSDLHENSYLAVNLIWTPAERIYCGVEYLFGIREDVDGSRGEANRLQAAIFFYLP